MAAPRGRGLRPGGIVRAMVRLVLLVVVGFGVGLVFGLVTEEPELIAGHLRGESEAVVLQASSEAEAAAPGDEARQDVYANAAVGPRPMVVPAEREDAASLPRVAAPAPESASTDSLSEQALAERDVRAAAANETRVAAAPPAPAAALRAAKSERASRAWAIQVGAFSEKGAARRLAATLSDSYPVEILPAKRDGERWRVRVQPIAGKERARATAEKLKREEGLPTWVTPMEGRSG